MSFSNVKYTFSLLFLFFSISPYSGYCQVGPVKYGLYSTEENKQTIHVLDGYKEVWDVDIFVCIGIRIDAQTGVEEKKENYASTNYISTDGIGRIYYDLPFSATSGIAFYDNNKKAIPSLAQYSSNGITYDGIIPDNVKYIRLSRRVDGDRGTKVIVYGSVYVQNEESFPFQEAENSRMINPRYRVFSNQEFVYKSGNSVCYYKVSMPNHQVLNDGTIVVVTELFGDGRFLAIKRSTDGGSTWNNNIRFDDKLLEEGIIKENDSGGNPVLLYDRNKDELYLFYQPSSYRKSNDGGISWGKKEDLSHLFQKEYAGYKFYASPCNGIQLSNGVLAIAYRIEDIDEDYDRVCVLFSRDSGKTWEVTPATPIKDKSGNTIFADETAIVEYKKNCIMLNSRGYSEISYGNRINRRVFIQRNRGAKNPRRWKVTDWDLEPISDLQLLDPVCQGSIVKASLEGKEFGVFTNIYSDNATRTNLLMRVSADFMHWSQCMFLTLPGEVVHGYSSMCCINDTFSVVSEDSKGIYYMPFNYEFKDKLLRTYSENFNTYK